MAEEIEVIKHTAEDLSLKLKTTPFSYFSVDDFLNEDFFKKLDKDFRNFYDEHSIDLRLLHKIAEVYPNHKLMNTPPHVDNMPITFRKDMLDNLSKQAFGISNSNIDTNFKVMGANVHYNHITHGKTIDYGGAGLQLDSFKALTEYSPYWKSFLDLIYSKDFFNYMFEIFKNTSEYKNRIGEQKICKTLDNKIEDPTKLNYFTGTKINRYTNNYGWVLHPDTSNKVLSFLLYLDNFDWPEDIKDKNGYSWLNGTQIWGFKNEKNKKFDSNETFKYNGNSIDFQLRDARSKDGGLLTNDQKENIHMIEDIGFKPNRLIGFINSKDSWHSILPMTGLPHSNNEVITRNCFQINIWQCDE